MAQTQIVADTSQSAPIPLGFCRVIADVVRRILKDQENTTTQTTLPINTPERTGARE